MLYVLLDKDPGTSATVEYWLNKFMKRCPECRRDYYDDTLLYCLDDGNSLLEGPASAEEPATAILEPGAIATGFAFGEARTELFRNKENAPIENSNSIAVLPFVNISADAENEYFCDGLSEELLNALAKIENLNVAARTSAFSFKGTNVNVSEIARALNVNSVLEGSVRKSDKRVRITAQLVNAADGYHLWSERYDREIQDIFDVQDEITLAVVDALKVKFFGGEKAEILGRKPNSAEALDLYLKGRFHFQQHTPEGFAKAIEFYGEAIDRDGNYAIAFAGLSSALVFQWFFGFVSADEAIPKARDAALRGLELNDDLDEAHIALAHILMFYERDLQEAEREYRRAIQLNPKNAYARYQYGLCLAVLGKREQAMIEAERSIELEPLSVLANFQVAAIYFHLGLYEDSSRYSQRLIEMSQEFYAGYLLNGMVFIAQGHFVEAIRMLEKALTLDHKQDLTISCLGQALGLAGDKTKAFERVRELQNERERRNVNAFDIARIYSSLRDVDKTIEWLEKAFDERNGEMVYLKLYAKLDGGDIWGQELIANERFQNLLKRTGLPE